MKTFYLFLFFILFVWITPFSQTNKYGLSKVTSNDNYNFISINQVKMWVSNTGSGSYNPYTQDDGFYWPGGPSATRSSIHADGLVWGGIVNSQLRVNGNTFNRGLQAGKILATGLPDDPALSKYRVYKILRGWETLPPDSLRASYELDYNEWPVEDGAPWIDMNSDGVYTHGIDKPKYVGDETLWYVANDMDTLRSVLNYGSLPIGLEFQTTIYGFDSTNFLADVVFKKYKIINKSSTPISGLYLSYWTDDDLGDHLDDYSGCVPYFHLGYTYNSDNSDGGGLLNTYGTPPPAVGHMLVQGPISPSFPNDSAYFNNKWRKGFINLPLSSHIFTINSDSIHRDPIQGNYSGTIEFYNNMQGLSWNATPYINPHNGEATLFPLNGDPAAGTGWFEGPGWPQGPNPHDRRSAINSGPITLAAGDTQEVVLAIFMAMGSDNLNSITILKQRAQQIQNFYGSFVPNLVNVSDEPIEYPFNFQLLQNYPNPFNPSTRIKYQLVEKAIVTLRVFNAIGQQVALLINNEQSSGVHEIEFNARQLSSGVYFYQLRAGEYVQSRKMILIK